LTPSGDVSPSATAPRRCGRFDQSVNQTLRESEGHSHRNRGMAPRPLGAGARAAIALVAPAVDRTRRLTTSRAHLGSAAHPAMSRPPRIRMDRFPNLSVRYPTVSGCFGD
jgi:hypothetical protein